MKKWSTENNSIKKDHIDSLILSYIKNDLTWMYNNENYIEYRTEIIEKISNKKSH